MTACRTAPEAAVTEDEEVDQHDQRPAQTMEKKRKSRSTPSWQADAGWKSVDVGDEFLLGAEEGGFAGLEVLEDYTILNDMQPTAGVCFQRCTHASVLAAFYEASAEAFMCLFLK